MGTPRRFAVRLAIVLVHIPSVINGGLSRLRDSRQSLAEFLFAVAHSILLLVAAFWARRLSARRVGICSIVAGDGACRVSSTPSNRLYRQDSRLAPVFGVHPSRVCGSHSELARLAQG